MATELYQHTGLETLPTLQALQPASTIVVGSVIAHSANAKPADPQQLVYATYPPSSAPPDEWLIIIPLSVPAGQARVFHSIEAVQDPPPDAITRARTMVVEVVREFLKLGVPGYADGKGIFGAVHELFAGALQSQVSGGPQRSLTATFLAPLEAVPIDTSNVDMTGLVMDHGRPADAPLMVERSGYRPESFYAARGPFTSVIRPALRAGEPTPAPAAWVLTSADGGVAALYTMPEYRRRGLAKAVIADRLAQTAKMGMRTFCHVEEDNDASKALWRGLGWQEAWECRWVY